MNNVIQRRVAVGEAYAALVAVQTVATVTITCPPANVGAVYFLGDDGSDVPWQPGECHRLERVNLADIRIKGTAGDSVTVVGGTW